MEYLPESEGGQLVDEFKEPCVAADSGVPARDASGALPEGLQQSAASDPAEPPHGQTQMARLRQLPPSCDRH
jgi:hypothetical protein